MATLFYLVAFLFLLSGRTRAAPSNIYNLRVDNVNGRDTVACRVSGDGVVNTVPCASLQYAISSIPLNAEQATINLTQTNVPYTKNNTNLRVEIPTFNLLGSDSIGRVVIDCEGHGSGFYVEKSNRFVMRNVEMRGCVGALGAALAFRQSRTSVVVDNCNFINNTAYQAGGAIYGAQSSSLTITNTQFHNNTAQTSTGGAISLDNIQLVLLRNVVMWGNYAGSVGGAVYLYNHDYVESSLMLNIVNITNNIAKSTGGGIYTDTPADTDPPQRTKTTVTTTNTTVFENNCSDSPYYDSYHVQIACVGFCNATRVQNITGCTDVFVPKPPTEESYVLSQSNIIVLAVLLPFVFLSAVAIGAYFYIRKKHLKEMSRRDEYRSLIVRALSFLSPEEVNPELDMCALCMSRNVAPLPCGDNVVCSACRRILLECPICKRGLKERSVTVYQPNEDKCVLCLIRPANAPLPCGDKVVCLSCRMVLSECPVCKTQTRERTTTL